MYHIDLTGKANVMYVQGSPQMRFSLQYIGHNYEYYVIGECNGRLYVGVRLICSKFFLLFYSTVLINFPYYSFYSIDYSIFSVDILRFIKVLLFFYYHSKHSGTIIVYNVR